MGEAIKTAVKEPETKRENQVSQVQKDNLYQPLSSPVGQILFLQRTIGNQAVQRLIKSGTLQAKRMPEAEVQQKPGCHFAKGPSCKENEDILKTWEVGGETTKSSPDVESRISSLRDGGQPLPESVNYFFKPRFGYDFSRVRVHSGAAAEQSARDVNAYAYTVGHDIVFGTGMFSPGTPQGRWLLAHELAHVVQQSAGVATEKTPGLEGSDPLEAQADAAATAVIQGGHASALDRSGKRLQQFPMCRTLWDPSNPSLASVSEDAVRNEIVRQRGSSGPVEKEFPIPSGSATPGRTEPRRGRGDVIQPQVIDPDITGKADIAQLNGTALELIEVKRADLPELVFAEAQVLRYIFQGNRAMGEVNRHWHRRGHTETLTSVRGMPSSRFVPISPQRIGGTPVSIAWCRDGVMTFKAMGDRDPEVFLCGVTDRGRIDAFLDRVTERAQTRVEEFIRDEVQIPASQVAARSLRDAARLILNRPEVRRFVPPGMSDDAILDMIVRQLQPFEAFIRAKANELIQRVVTELRQMLQAQIRNLLQVSFNALCAATAEMTARELLDEFNRRMRQQALQLIPIAVMAAARAMYQAMVAEFAAFMLEALAYVAAAVAVVIAAIVLWEVAAAIAAAGAIETGLAAAAEFVMLIFSRLAFQ